MGTAVRQGRDEDRVGCPLVRSETSYQQWTVGECVVPPGTGMAIYGANLFVCC